MTKSLTTAEIMQILGKEIMWCEENPDRVLSAEYRKGFINGLIQARNLIGEANRQVRMYPNGHDTIPDEATP